MSMFKVSAPVRKFGKFQSSVDSLVGKTMSDVPVVFLSFDEPNADAHWENLKSIVPHSRVARVHGVKGFDAAHKAAGEQFYDSEYVITVDADNIVDSKFFKKPLPNTIDQGFTYTWGGRQYTNGLMYGNGGIKLWNRQHLINMRSHENSTSERDAVDFCWDFSQYRELAGCFSTVYTNGSPYQAFRVGFREGIKLCLEQGGVIDPNNIKNEMHAANFQRLLTWMTIGRDVEHGAWSMYGARLAVKMLYYDDFDHVNIRDYQWFKDFFAAHEHKQVLTELTVLSVDLTDVFGFRIPGFTSEESSFIKQLQLHPEKPLTYEDVEWRTNLKLFGWFK